MGVIKTGSDNILEETVVPSEEANHSLQGHTGECLFISFSFYYHVSTQLFCFPLIILARAPNATQGTLVDAVILLTRNSPLSLFLLPSSNVLSRSFERSFLAVP